MVLYTNLLLFFVSFVSFVFFCNYYIIIVVVLLFLFFCGFYYYSLLSSHAFSQPENVPKPFLPGATLQTPLEELTTLSQTL